VLLIDVIVTVVGFAAVLSVTKRKDELAVGPLSL
jgi:hypothetical protein